MLAFSAADHPLNKRVTRWLDSVPAEGAVICRFTQTGFLRLLTNPKAMNGLLITPLQAWQLYDEIRADSRFVYAEEPKGVDILYYELTSSRERISGSTWTDLYLYAFAAAGGFTLVTLDENLAQVGPPAELIP